ncbi:MAG: hypothetical protein Q9219_004237 [cf. Caloplaca sp. 3 TL-2023]
MPSTAPLYQHPQNSYLPPLFLREGPGFEEERKVFASDSEPHSRPSIRPAEVRHGLRTPPGDMSGVGVNPLLAPNFEASQYKSVPASAWNGAPRQGSIGSIINGRCHDNPNYSQSIYHNRSRSHEHASLNLATSKDDVPKSQRDRDESSIVSYLQIPSSVNESKGSLAEFAAQITCLFWFESSFTLLYVEESKATPVPIEPLVLEAIPTMGFRKWVVSILSTTQVSQNVILLALMFIYRLKKLNPGVKGKLGSEFRLFTVALMLGNKCESWKIQMWMQQLTVLVLDDNTYTNKTWAEVSGISVQDIHIMEVEFLSNMRYTLYASETEWKAWHVKLGKFWKYFEAGLKTPVEVSPRVLKPPAPSPGRLPNLPSPPLSTHTSPPYTASHSFNGDTSAYPYPLTVPPYLPPVGPSPLGPLAECVTKPASRKRSHDQTIDNVEPPVKRPALSRGPSASSSTAMTPSAHNGLTPNTSMTTPSTGYVSSLKEPRLPTPNLSISTGNPSSGYRSTASIQLPFPGGTSKPTNVSNITRPSHPGVLPSLSQNMRLNREAGYGISPSIDRSSQQFPSSAAGTPSPTSVNFPQSAQTPTHLSPAAFTFPRNSPYKPIRSVHTLLVPPPSASLQSAPPNLNYSQMYYQPLGKPISQSRPGVLPMMQQDSRGQPIDKPVYLPQPRYAS